MNLATVYEEQGQLAKAEATYLQAIAQWREADRPGEQALAFSHLARAQYNLARLLLNQGVRSRAESAVRAALEYDQKSEGILDLCRTVELYDMIEMELAGRRTDSAVEEMAGVGAALKQLAHRGSLFEMKEAARVARRRRRISGSCAVAGIAVVAVLQDSGGIVCLGAGERDDGIPAVSAAEGSSWTLAAADSRGEAANGVGGSCVRRNAHGVPKLAVVRAGGGADERMPLFGGVFTHPEIPQFSVPARLLPSSHSPFPPSLPPNRPPNPIPISLHRISLQSRHALLQVLLPSLQVETPRTSPANRRGGGTDGNSRGNRCFVATRASPASRSGRTAITKRAEVSFPPSNRGNDGDFGAWSKKTPFPPTTPAEPTPEERGGIPEVEPISAPLPKPSSVPSQQDAHEMEVRVCAVLAGNEQEYREFLPQEQARNREYLNTLLVSRIRRDFVISCSSINA